MTLAASPNYLSPVLPPEYDLPVLDPMAPPSLKSLVGPELRRSIQVSIPPPYFTNYHCYFTLATLYEPHTYHEAHTDLLWQQGMNEELDTLHKNHTWDMVDLPPSKSVVGCKWFYKIKTRVDGSFERYKARLVAKGFTQEYGINYEEIFALVARLTSVRCLITVTVVHYWLFYQMDVKNVFLNGDIQEEVYMQPPPGYPYLFSIVGHYGRISRGLERRRFTLWRMSAVRSYHKLLIIWS